MATYLLDTSAWLAHVFDEPGADEVTALFEDAEATIALSALSILEAHARFRVRNRDADFEEMLENYGPVFTRIYPVDESIVRRAIALRRAGTKRLSALDSLIAATAAQHNAILVHRDAHFMALPSETVTQLPLDVYGSA